MKTAGLIVPRKEGNYIISVVVVSEEEFIRLARRAVASVNVFKTS